MSAASHAFHADIAERLQRLLDSVQRQDFKTAHLLTGMLNEDFRRLMRPQRDPRTRKYFTPARKLGLSSKHVTGTMAAVKNASLAFSRDDVQIAIDEIGIAITSWTEALGSEEN
jgi:hypothetical protein